METMSSEKKNILVINAGSSSLKYKLYAMPQEELLHKGLTERLHDNHAAALQPVMTTLKSNMQIDAIAHRVVHGGTDFTQAVRITNAVKSKISHLSELAPLHNPVNLACIEATEQIFESTPQFAVFDTAFHHTLPPEASSYAIDEQVAKDCNIRVFGFHGISHRYVSAAAGQFLKRNDARIVSLHLGNGCSMAAIKGGISIDTSMGFSPLSGLVMATRSGDIDPVVPLYLCTKLGWQPADAENFLNKKSGLKGICGMEDMRDIKKAARQNNAAALLARRLYVYRIKKYIGAYAAALGGLDALVFTGGVGENDADLRKEVSAGMEWLNIKIDDAKNQHASSESLTAIQATGAPCQLLVIPANEELEIARQVERIFDF
ncbi:MAG: acetate/propionate family kinase [Agriterribacter sp.]